MEYLPPLLKMLSFCTIRGQRNGLKSSQFILQISISNKVILQPCGGMLATIEVFNIWKLCHCKEKERNAYYSFPKWTTGEHEKSFPFKGNQRPVCLEVLYSTEWHFEDMQRQCLSHFQTVLRWEGAIPGSRVSLFVSLKYKVVWTIFASLQSTMWMNLFYPQKQSLQFLLVVTLWFFSLRLKWQLCVFHRKKVPFLPNSSTRVAGTTTVTSQTASRPRRPWASSHICLL